MSISSSFFHLIYKMRRICCGVNFKECRTKLHERTTEMIKPDVCEFYIKNT